MRSQASRGLDKLRASWSGRTEHAIGRQP
ncbi:hypothetical protein [Micromonospora sp. CPCC 206061]